jgi:chemotaxis protein MotB
MAKGGWMVLGLVAALASAGCASEDWQSKYEASSKDLLDTSMKLDDAKAQRAEAESRAESMAQQLKQTDIEAQRAREAADAAAKQYEEARAQILANKSAKSASSSSTSSATIDAKGMQALVDQLRRELGKGATTVGVTPDGNIEITLASDVTFGAGSAELSEAGRKSIKTLAPILKGKFAPYQVRVEGHTDATPLAKTKPKYSDNFGLGSARSLAVVRFMETDLGIEPTRLMSASRGEHNPKADNKSDSGKRQNRRVEVVVVVPHDAAMSMAK